VDSDVAFPEKYLLENFPENFQTFSGKFSEKTRKICLTQIIISVLSSIANSRYFVYVKLKHKQ